MADYRSTALEAWGEACALCHTTVGLEVHHINENHGDDDVNNLMPVCGTCHNLITAGEVYIDPATREPRLAVTGMFERGSSAGVPPMSVQVQVAAFRSAIPDTWQLAPPRGLLLLQDGVSGAFYTECHIPASTLVSRFDIETLIDPRSADEGSEYEQYRFNRRLNESSDVFQRLVRDAMNGRPFSDIIVEWNTEYDGDRPLKVLGGQHRVSAIKRATEAGREAGRLHGVRVYFDLNVTQRVELVTIANSNIDIPNPLLDRIAEHQLGAGSRSWCQRVGLLEPGQDFTDRVAGSDRMTVQVMRAFVTNYILGREFQGNAETDMFRDITIPGTGSYEPDKAYNAILKKHPNIWDDEGLGEAGRQFARLNAKQVTETTDAADAALRLVAFRYKALQPTVAAGWAFVAGLLHQKPDRLTLLYKLPDHYDKRTSKDPLNALAMSRAKHTADPPTYRGLGTRQNTAEAQKLAELFRLVSDPSFHNHITKDLIDYALTEFHRKNSVQEAEDARRRAQNVARQIGTD